MSDESEPDFRCPNCGGVQKAANTKVQELQKKVETLERQKQWAKDDAEFERKEKERTRHQLAAAKGHQTRLKKRIAGGVCPCCSRTFQNLAQHMQGQHPEFAVTEDGGAK